MKQLLFGALAAAALGAGSAQAATIFAQNFEGALSANESVGGQFAAGAGYVGHQSVYYASNEYSFYQVRLDLTQAADALLAFDFDLFSEWTYDGLNLAYSTDGAFTPDRVLTPASGATYYNLYGRAGALMGPKAISGDQSGRATFDLTSLVGQVVDIRFQFASDHAAIGQGVKIDNLVVTGALPSAVPEPATWAMMITGFGLAGGAIRARRRSEAAAA